MTTDDGKKGCRKNLERVAIYIIILVVLVAIVYRIYGDAFRAWLVNQTLNGVEGDVLSKRPDGISEDDVRSNFERVKKANSEREIDLKKLHQILDDYQSEFKNKKPSTDEIREFLSKLNSVILTDSEQE